MAKIEQTGRGKSVESKLDAQPERNHFATLRGLVRYRLQKLMRANVRWVKKPHLGKARFWQSQRLSNGRAGLAQRVRANGSRECAPDDGQGAANDRRRSRTRDHGVGCSHRAPLLDAARVFVDDALPQRPDHLFHFQRVLPAVR